MLITHGAVVSAAFDQPQTDAGDAADVGDGIFILGRDEIDPDDVVDIQRFDIERSVADLDVDLCAAAAAADRALAVSGDAAGKVLAVDAARRAAVADHAQVFADDAADGDQALHRAGKAAAGQRAAARADDTADAAAAAVGHDRAGHVQIKDAPVLLQIAEQTLMRAVGGAEKVFDRMAVAVESAGEGRDGHERAAGEIDVVDQPHVQPDRPGAAAAIARKGLKILGRGDGDHLALVLAGGTVRIPDDKLSVRAGDAFDPVPVRFLVLPFRKDCGGKQGKHDRERAKHGDQNEKRLPIILHGPAPPFPVRDPLR